MNDRELLEAAARAAGMRLNHQGYPTTGNYYDTPDHEWNPLTDDGDALRLAVQLHLSLVDYKNEDHTERRTSVKVWEGHEAFLFMQELHGTDPLAATRRAIVRAAAALGAAMEGKS